MNRLKRHCTYANVVATLALLFAVGGTAGAAVMITSNNQVAKNTISGHHPPSGMHANLFLGSVNGNDLSTDLRSSIKVHCASGMSSASDICFEPNLRAATGYSSALSACATSGRRLPTLAETAEVFNWSGAPQPIQWTDGWFWSPGDQSDEGTTVAEDSSRNMTVDFWVFTTPIQFRCVANRSN